MRVIAGKAKGRRLYSVPGPGTRPVTDRAKTALFNILGRAVVNARFLDLFAGTGQVGIESLSRGAELAVFVETGEMALRTIRKNLSITGLEERAEVLRADVYRYLSGEPQAFHYIYNAPPQYRGLWIQTLRFLNAAPSWLTGDGWVISQIHPQEYDALELDNLELFDQREYGSVMFCFHRLRIEEGLNPL